MVILDLRAGRFEDAAAHLREGLQIATRTGGWFELHNGLDGCGYLCAATGRHAEAVTMWAAHAALARTRAPRLRLRSAPPGSRCARPGRRSDPTGPVPPRTAARR